MFLEADEALLTDDEVVDQLDVEDAPGLHQLPRRLEVLLGGRGVAAGMVVSEDEGGAVANDGLAEDLRGA